jgi:nucleoside-diphosphate-sugar epimerase
MHILLTGSSGSVGSGVLLHLLEQNHTVVALDIVPLPERLLSQIPASSSSRLTTHVMDLCDFKPLDELFSGVIHLSAIPHPIGSDPRTVHNNNVTSSYNVLTTAVMYGVKRIVQASSVNAIGLTYTPEGLQRFEALPLTEESPFVEVSGRHAVDNFFLGLS